MINFPIENIPSLKSYIKRQRKMMLKALPYKGFAPREDTIQRITQAQVDNTIEMLKELPSK